MSSIVDFQGKDLSDATATANKIVSGYTAYTGAGKIIGNLISVNTMYVPGVIRSPSAVIVDKVSEGSASVLLQGNSGTVTDNNITFLISNAGSNYRVVITNNGSSPIYYLAFEKSIYMGTLPTGSNVTIQLWDTNLVTSKGGLVWF